MTYFRKKNTHQQLIIIFTPSFHTWYHEKVHLENEFSSSFIYLRKMIEADKHKTRPYEKWNNYLGLVQNFLTAIFCNLLIGIFQVLESTARK